LDTTASTNNRYCNLISLYQMSEAGYDSVLSPNGLYSAGAFSRITSSRQGGSSGSEEISALMETDSLYVLISSSSVKMEKEVDKSVLSMYESPSLDVMNAWEKKYFCDEVLPCTVRVYYTILLYDLYILLIQNAGILTTKKDSDSSSGGK